MSVQVRVVGAGVAGLCCATELCDAGYQVEVVERRDSLAGKSCSWLAGGMLAPDCESVDAHPVVPVLGRESLSWWEKQGVPLARTGSLLVARQRDEAELAEHVRRCNPASFRWLHQGDIGALEPALGTCFSQGLHFPEEGHIDPRQALTLLEGNLRSRGVVFRYGEVPARESNAVTVDCRGLAARDLLPNLRGVKGEMLILRCPEVQLHRPVRLVHPRIPLYIVPRGEFFMVGATMLESQSREVSARSLVELLHGAYAVHSAFAEAEVVEIGCDLRPAFPDNQPRVGRIGDNYYLNGLFRHGFLMAPALARQLRKLMSDDLPAFSEVSNEDPLQQPSTHH